MEREKQLTELYELLNRYALIFNKWTYPTESHDCYEAVLWAVQREIEEIREDNKNDKQ